MPDSHRMGGLDSRSVDPLALPSYLSALDFNLIEDVDADAYRERYLRPLGRAREPLAEFQRAALAEVAR